MRRPDRTKYFHDWEFMERSDGVLEPLSIGVVCEDGREFYRENADANWSHANDWVRAHVFPHMHSANAKLEYDSVLHSAQGKVPDLSHSDVVPRGRIAIDLRDFVNEGEHFPLFHGWYSSYDWVLTCQLFGRMIDLPRSWPQFCIDLAQTCYERGIRDPKLAVPVQGTEHNSLDDARWTRDLYNYLYPEE